MRLSASFPCLPPFDVEAKQEILLEKVSSKMAIGTKERLIDKLRNELYKKHNWTGETAVKFMVPIILAIRHKDAQALAKDTPEDEAIVWALQYIREGGKRELDTVLNQITQSHQGVSPLLQETLESMIASVMRQPDGIILDVLDYLDNNKDILRALRNEDFIGTLFERSVSDAFRGDDGRFYTPRNIILLVREMMRLLLKHENPEHPISSYTACDPCCGSARFLIYWSELIIDEIKLKNPSIKRPELLKQLKKTAERNLFGADIHEDTAAFGCLNMLLHGDGATNITDHDSLDHFGFFADMPLLNEFALEFQDKWDTYRSGSQRPDIAELLDKIEAKKAIVNELLNTDKIDLSNVKWLELTHIIRDLLIVDRQYPTGWKSIRALQRRFKRRAVFETMVDVWATRNPDVIDNFDIVMSNPPFGRQAELMINDPYLLCQYKLATEIWVRDMNKGMTELVLTRTLAKGTSLYSYYILLLHKHFNKLYVEAEDEVKFEKLSLLILRRLANDKRIQWGGQSKTALAETLAESLNRHIVTIDDDVRLTDLSNNEAKRVCSEYLYEGGTPGKLLTHEIVNHFNKEWLTVEDISGTDGYASKSTLVFNGKSHTIYYDHSGKPIIFKGTLPKQVLFIEQFLRMVKDGGKVFTVLDTGVLSNIGDEYVRQFIYKNARVHTIVEFPHGAFKAAEANVKTAVVLLEKGEHLPNYQFFGALPMYLGYRLNDQNVPPIPQNDLGKVLCDYSVHLGFSTLLPHCCQSSSQNETPVDNSCNWFQTRSCTFWKNQVEV